MLNIAICDDLPAELAKLEAFVNEYVASNRTDANIAAFSHPDALMSACEKAAFHIYILDVVMPMVDGVSLGRMIRRLDREAQIIYVTTEPRFALDAYAANPLNFLIKPLDKTKLFDTLTLAVSKLDLPDAKTVAVKTAEGLRVVRLADIAFCEHQNHKIIYSLLSGEVVTSRTIAGKFAGHIAALLDDRRFVSPHSSFAVNMTRVERFNKDCFILRGGAVIPIAAKQYPAVRDAYMDYLMARDVRQ